MNVNVVPGYRLSVARVSLTLHLIRNPNPRYVIRKVLGIPKKGLKNHAVSDKEVKDMFKTIDGDGDGLVTLEEFSLFAKVNKVKFEE